MAYSNGSHSSLVSPLVGLNLDPFDPFAIWASSSKPLPVPAPKYQVLPDIGCSYRQPQYIPPNYQFSYTVPYQQHRHTAYPDPSTWSWSWAPQTYKVAPRQTQHFQYVPQRPIEFPASPSDTCSTASPMTSPSAPVSVVPLLAPKPLPYHSPTFLEFELPDDDEDLSHPPYVRRPSKRKREQEEEPDSTADDQLRSKRRASESEVGMGPWWNHGRGTLQQHQHHHSSRRPSLPGTLSGVRRRR